MIMTYDVKVFPQNYQTKYLGNEQWVSPIDWVSKYKNCEQTCKVVEPEAIFLDASSVCILSEPLYYQCRFCTTASQ